MFQNIECEWPLFFCYLVIDHCFQGNKETAADYLSQLEKVKFQKMYSEKIEIIMPLCR